MSAVVCGLSARASLMLVLLIAKLLLIEPEEELFDQTLDPTPVMWMSAGTVHTHSGALIAAHRVWSFEYWYLL